MPTLLRPLALLALLVASGCASGPSSSAGTEPLRVTLHGYKTAQRFELVSESHTPSLEYYSQARRDAARKIQEDEIMEELVEELDRQGFEDHAQDGRAPSSAGTLLSWSLEIQRGDELEHWVVGQGTAPDERRGFNSAMNSFVQLYNLTASYQTIENPEGKELFESSAPRSRP